MACQDRLLLEKTKRWRIPTNPPPQTAENPFSEQPMDAPVPSGSGMVNQVQIVCILMIVQGSLTTLMGLFYLGYAAFIPVLFRLMESTDPSAKAPPASLIWIIAGVILVIGLPVMIAGPLQIWAGIRNLQFRGYRLGMTALIAGSVSALTIYCAPTAIGLLIYGLIVYRKPEVAQAFRMGEDGMSRQQILAAFWPYRPPRHCHRPQNEHAHLHISRKGLMT